MAFAAWQDRSDLRSYTGFAMTGPMQFIFEIGVCPAGSIATFWYIAAGLATNAHFLGKFGPRCCSTSNGDFLIIDAVSG
jgi:hypothetical protein